MGLDDYRYDVGGAPVVFSTGHKRPDNPLNRPEIHYEKMILSLVGLAVLVAAVFLGSGIACSVAGAELDIVYRILLCVAAAVVYMMSLSRRAVIWLVHLYQNKASDATRLRCVFEPSCSEYMILAVEKYGTIRGVIKGVRRLLRCHAPNGGQDYP